LTESRLRNIRLRRRNQPFGLSDSGPWRSRIERDEPPVRQTEYARMPGKHRRWTIDQLAVAVAAERSLAGVLRRLGLRAAGGNYENVHRVVRANGLSTEHWTGQSHLRGQRNPHVPKIPLARLLVKGSTYHSNKLRRRLLAEGVFRAFCSNCGQDEWLGQKIPLELDHIDGDRQNNLLSNIRLVCPNCHALTPTYRGRNVRLRRTYQEQAMKQ
jgi:hypothetical protein